MADYYVSATGNDSNNGSLASPWKTVTHVNAVISGSIGLNNRVLFRRGDTFYGALRLPTNLNSAASGWLKIGAYGTDPALPIICGYKILNTPSGWVEHDANTWQIDYSAVNSGLTYTGYDSAQGDDDVGILKVDGVIHANSQTSLGALTNQWDYYSTGTTLYVRSTAKPTSLAGDVRCTVHVDGISLYSATEVSDLNVLGWGGHGVSIGDVVPVTRTRLLRCTIGEIGGTWLNPTLRYGNGVQVWYGGTTQGSSNIYMEHNTVRDVYDTAFTIQGGQGESFSFTDITWRRNLTYRCSQAEEYWYIGTGGGFVNCVSEYNTNLFAGYGFGGDTRPDTEVRVFQLSYLWGNPDTLTVGPTLRRNIYYDARTALTHWGYTPNGLSSERNLIYLRPGTKMRDSTSQTVEQATAWSVAVGRDQNSVIGILPASMDTDISDADVTAAIASLDHLVAFTGQKFGGKAFPIHSPWRAA